jgi:hypothetical protein
MWSLNFILPSLIGFFLMLHKPKNIMKY